MQLCAATLVVDDPEECVLTYVDPDGGYAYPSYDRLVTNNAPELVDGDLLAPTLLEAHVDLARFSVLRRMLPSLGERLAALPDVALEDAGDDVVEAVARCFDVLDEKQFAGRGVRGTIISKVLHRKRPDLVPLYDSRIWTAYTATGAVPRASHRTWVEFMVLLCKQMRDDINANRDEFESLRKVAAGAGAQLTLLRILDILVWMSSEPPV
jgi:Family of unknown function (DUF6308)